MNEQITHDDYLESLRYAKLIQEGLLPKRRHFKRSCSDYFVFFQPKQYVSGDFYWIAEKKECVYLAVIDCTGHGVPGAMLSILAKSILEYTIMNKGITRLDLILKELDKKFIESFSNKKEERFDNDWLDIALVKFDKEKKKLQFSGANRKILLVEGQNALTLKGNAFPIGGWQVETNRTFDVHSVSYEPGTMLYMGSDGFQDQLGGERRKKFGAKQLHDLLLTVASRSAKDQCNALKTAHHQWKGKEAQTDDICILGIRL